MPTTPASTPSPSPSAPTSTPVRDAPSSSRVLELIAKSVFACGLGEALVERRWPATVAAFEGFDPEVVATWSQSDVDRLASDPRLIRNRRKIRAVLENARRLRKEIESAGGLEDWLESLGTGDEARERVIATFAWVGEVGAGWVVRGLALDDG